VPSIELKLRELFGADLRSLAALRIGLGLCVLADVATRGVDLVGLYTDRGVLPRTLLLETEGPGVYLSAHYWASVHPALEGALFALTAACAVALVAGWRTRLATLACWYLVSSLQIRQPLVYIGADSILRLMLFWGLFLPLGARFSADDAQGRAPRLPDLMCSGATIAVLLQVCLIYWATGLRKTGELWWNGQAIFAALHLDEWATPLGVWMRDYPALLEPLTYATLALELLGPFLAFVPLRTGVWRLVTIGVFWIFHLSLASVMNIGLFPLFSMVAWLAFLPSQFWSWCGVSTRAEALYPGVRARAASIVALICLTYVVVVLAERARIIPDVIPSAVTAVGRTLRLQQSWNMFAPDPDRVTVAHDVRKTMVDGTQRTEAAATSFRWRIYLGRAATGFPLDHPWARSVRRFADFQCRQDNAIDRVAVIMHRRNIDERGPGERRSRELVDEYCAIE
jgi:hypothetical protein